jgi:hypothetical protein
LLAIGAITLTPLGGSSPGASLCLICGRRGSADALLNLFMFWPVGWLVAGAARKQPVLWAALAGALLSLAIEVGQIPIPGRDASVGDLAFNAAGALVGGAAWRTYRRVGAASVVPAAIALVAAVTTLAGFALLLAPTFPDSRWWGQWTPDLGHLERYDGRVLDASVGGEPLPGGGELPEGQRIRARLRGFASVDVAAIAGDPPPGLAPIVSVYDERQREMMLLGADGADVVWRVRTLGSALRFDDVALRFPGALAATGRGDTVSLRLATAEMGQPWGEGACLRSGPGAPSCARWTVASTWGLLLPIAGPFGRVLGMLWIAALFFPAGVLAAATSARARIGVAVAAGAGVLLVPWFTPIGAARAEEVLAAIAAAALPGLWLGVRRRTPGAGRTPSFLRPSSPSRP